MRFSFADLGNSQYLQYGSHFGEEGNRDAAIFIYTLYQMSEHKLPTGGCDTLMLVHYNS